VIVGHASQVLLAYEPRALKVLLTGSLERRVQRVAEQENRSLEDARKMVRDSDDERRTFFKQTYSIDLLSAENYDLALNTDHLSVEAAVELIASVAHRRTESTRDSDDDMQRVLQP
jgi:cytidylate kinase